MCAIVQSIFYLFPCFAVVYIGFKVHSTNCIRFTHSVVVGVRPFDQYLSEIVSWHSGNKANATEYRLTNQVNEVEPGMLLNYIMAQQNCDIFHMLYRIMFIMNRTVTKFNSLLVIIRWRYIYFCWAHITFIEPTQAIGSNRYFSVLHLKLIMQNIPPIPWT